ncbi:MAG: hypothetical protein KAF91_26175 [Nostoc sp. TH1S01]|nr:hypothetical protein [Nostoc sp. TH1S01]
MNTSNPQAFIELPGSEVRQKFDEIETGIFRAIDFLKSEFNVFSLKLLPMENILVVLTAFFASSQKQPPPIPEEQNKVIKQWFWRACLSQRYARGGSKITDTDLEEVRNLKNNTPNKLGDFEHNIDYNYFIKNAFNMSSIATKTFILLLAHNKPLTFIQGTSISLDNVLSQGNRKEFHHIFPKAYLKTFGDIYKDEQINCLANFSLLVRTDNNKIKDKSPIEYLNEMPTNEDSRETILKTHFCSTAMLKNDYNIFLRERADLLMKKVQELS